MSAHCPSWCTADHAAETAMLDVLGGFTHTATVGTVTTSCGRSVHVVRCICTTAAGDPDDEGPVIFIDNATTSLTADDAEALARHLDDAAQRLRRSVLRSV